jgi:hypothetical protein
LYPAAKGGVELGEVARAAGIVAEGLGVPAAGVDAEAAMRREAAPEAPHGRAFAFLIGGHVEGEGLDAAGIEPGVEDIDHLALAGGGDAGDDDEHGERGVLELHLHVHEFRANIGDAGFVGFFGKTRCGVGFGHVKNKWRRARGLSSRGLKRGGDGEEL